MSEACKIYFLNVRDEGDAFIKANKIAKKIKKCGNEYILENKYSIPSHRDTFLLEEKNKYTEKLGKDADELWLYCLFNHKFIYWKKYHLLGLVGFSYPKEVEDMFDLSHEFQNSSDTNYELDTWGITKDIKNSPIPLFNEIIEEYIDFYDKIRDNISIAQKIVSKYKWINEYSLRYMKDYFEENDGTYWLLSSLYDAIENALNVLNILYNEEDEELYTLFSINSILGKSGAYELLPLVRKAAKEVEKENEELINSLKK